MKIFKYPIAVIDKQEVDMPKGASILCCQVQHDELCLWALVYPDAPIESRTILVVGTGHNIPFDPVGLKYIGTVQQLEGDLVLHVLELY